MKTKIISALLLVGQMALAQVTIKKTITDFKKLHVNASTTVYLKKADAPYVSYESKDSSSTDLRIMSEDGSLMISEQKNKDLPDKVIVGFTNLEDIMVTGAATLKSSDAITAEKLGLQVSGAAKCKLDLAVTDLSCSVSGAASCSLAGQAGSLNAIVSGAASFKAEDLVTSKAQVNASGASTAKINVSESLTGIVSGACTLRYMGDPKEVRLNQSGASTVKRIDKDGNSASSNNSAPMPGTTVDGDSVHKYTINGRYEIIVHDNLRIDTTTIRYKRKHDSRIRKQNWCGVDLFENGYLTPDKDISLAAANDYMSPNYGIRNLGWNLNLFEKDFRFANGHLQVVTGMGFSFNYYALKNKTTLNADSSFTSTYAYNTSADYSKNKLRESFITVPLLLELNTSKRDSRNFHIAAGVIGGLKLGSSTKQIFTQNNHTFETVRHDDYNLFPFKLDATVRVGYGDFTLFATYSLTPLFEYNKGPELYPFTIGVRICPFN